MGGSLTRGWHGRVPNSASLQVNAWGKQPLEPLVLLQPESPSQLEKQTCLLAQGWQQGELHACLLCRDSHSRASPCWREMGHASVSNVSPGSWGLGM